MKKRCKWITLGLICIPLKLVAQAPGEEVGYWLDKYQSVSYPLKSIHISSPYGERTDPFTKKTKFHQGIDLKAQFEEVYAMFDGTIKHVGYDPASGNYVTLQAGNYTLSYCHLSEIWVREGDTVYASQPLGRSGSSGRATGPHLHLSCRLLGKIENPYHLLTFVRETQQKAVEALGLNNQEPMSPEVFIEAYAPFAMNQQIKHGIPSSVILAQMAFESGWGGSNLARIGNNFFGIKANNRWLSKGLPYSCHDDDKPNEKFCNFSSPEESIEYHSRLLMSDRYKNCHRYSSTDHRNWLKAIKQAGYATNKNYVAYLERIITRYKLHEYDQMAESM